MERTPSGRRMAGSIAYFSDESGEYALHIKPQSGSGEVRKIALAGKSAFYFGPQWSPDSKHIAFTDNQLNLWDVEVAAGKLTRSIPTITTSWIAVLRGHRIPSGSHSQSICPTGCMSSKFIRWPMVRVRKSPMA